MSKKVFITGASGCVGHYVVQQLLAYPDYEIHVLLRKPERLSFKENDHDTLHVHVGDLKTIEEQRAILEDVDYIMHIATDWSNSDYARYLNLQQTELMFSLADPEKLKKIIYFSTASILGAGNQVIDEAGTYGAGYVKSKYQAYHALQKNPLKDRIITLFPTMVFGGDDLFPKSHINKGLIPNLHFTKILRFFYVDGAFHFLHSKDIAAVAIYTMMHDVDHNEYCLGNDVITVKQAIKSICRVFDVSMFFSIKIPKWFIFLMAKLFKIVIGPWERHCIKHSNMVYDVVNPATFKLKTAFPTLQSVLEDIKSQNKAT